jgi:hypothetical protein
MVFQRRWEKMVAQGRHSPRLLGWVVLLSLGLTAWPFLPATAQSSSAIVSGRVVDENEAPLKDMLVGVLGLKSVGALTDDEGRFLIRSIPAGSHAIRAWSAGYEPDAVFLQLQQGDSVDVVLRLERTRIPFPGASVPIPGTSVLLAAARVLPQLLGDSAVTSLVQTHWPEMADGDTLPVLASWMESEDTLFLGQGPTFRVSRECVECVALLTQTLEGGGAYRAGARHVNVGVRAGGIGTLRVNFCIALVENGDFLLQNCGSLGGGRTEAIMFMRRGPGDWVRFPG